MKIFIQINKKNWTIDFIIFVNYTILKIPLSVKNL